VRVRVRVRVPALAGLTCERSTTVERPSSMKAFCTATSACMRVSVASLAWAMEGGSAPHSGIGTSECDAFDSAPAPSLSLSDQQTDDVE
jgi:hypothetical protein